MSKSTKILLVVMIAALCGLVISVCAVLLPVSQTQTGASVSQKAALSDDNGVTKQETESNVQKEQGTSSSRGTASSGSNVASQKGVATVKNFSPDASSGSSSSGSSYSVTNASETGTSDDYILPESSSRYISSEELSSLSAEKLNLARNEIFARHGRKFQDSSLQAYFNSKSWYTPSIEPEDFDYDTMLNQYEKANIRTIQDEESGRASGSGSSGGTTANDEEEDSRGYCPDLLAAYPSSVAAFSGDTPVEREDYYELTVNVYGPDEESDTGAVLGTAVIRIRKDAQVMWRGNDGVNSLISLDAYAANYWASDYAHCDHTRIWYGSDQSHDPEDKGAYQIYYDSNGYITQFYDGEFD